MLKQITRGILILSLLGMPGCRVGPGHVVPIVAFEEEWQSEDSKFSSDEPLALGELFDDPLLRHYLERIVSENNDIRIALMKVGEAYALRTIAAAKLYPMVDSRVAYNSSKPAGGILRPGETTPAMGGGGGILGGIPLNLKQQTFLINFDALWEIDLFGKRRREVESASAFVGMECASYRDAIITLTAEFGRTYLELRRAQAALNLIKDEMNVLEEKISASEERLLQGVDNELTVLDNQEDLDTLSAEYPLLQGQIRHFIYRLSVLLGKAPATLAEELELNPALPGVRKTIPVGLPSDLLRRRPDIRFAEKQLAKSAADVGVAVADIFPKLTLTGSYGFQNLHLGNMKGEGESWSYGGNLITPVFHGGSLKGNVERYQWIRREAFLTYEQTVLNALEESESAIARYLKSQESLEEREKAYSRSKQLLDHTEGLYEGGLANNVQLFDRKLRSVQAERNLIDSRADSEIELIALYKALGGCW